MKENRCRRCGTKIPNCQEYCRNHESNPTEEKLKKEIQLAALIQKVKELK